MAEDDNRRKRGNTLRLASGEFAAVAQAASPLANQDSTTGPKSLPPLPGEETKPGVAPPESPVTGIHEKWDSDPELDRPTRNYGDKPKEDAVLGIFPTRMFEVNTVLVQPGEELPCLIIDKGTVDMSIVGADGKPRSIRLLYEGDMIGAAKFSTLHGLSLTSEFRFTTVTEGRAYVVPPEAFVTFTTEQKNYLLTALAENAKYSDQAIVDLTSAFTSEHEKLSDANSHNEKLTRDVKRHIEENRLLAQHLMDHGDREKAQQEFILSLKEEAFFDLIGSNQPSVINKGLIGMRDTFLSLGL